MILRGRYTNYERSLQILDLAKLDDRREKLCYTFAKKSIKNGIIDFKEIDKSKYMTTRNRDTYEVTFCNTERLKKSALPHMQRSLNIREALK